MNILINSLQSIKIPVPPKKTKPPKIPTRENTRKKKEKQTNPKTLKKEY